MAPATATQDSHHPRIKELIYDEEKIITSTSLANELKVSRNDAQNIFDAFVKDNENKERVDIHATYLLYGLLNDGQGVGVYLVKDEDLQDKKRMFQNIEMEVVYSVQKVKQVDFNMIALVNAAQEHGTCLVTSKNCFKRSIKSKKLPITQPATATSVKQNGTSLRNCPSTSSENGNVDRQDNHKSLSQKQPKGKQGGIANFFSKAATKTQNSVKMENTKNENGEKSKSDIDKVPDIIKPKQEVVKKETLKNEKMDTSTEIASPKAEVVEKQMLKNEKMDTNTKVEKSILKENKDQNSSKKRKKASKDKGSSKKRKRIQEVSDSDSDDIFGDGENNDVIEMSDEEPVHVPVVIPPPIPKNKKRKAVDKTCMDEEGFMVTTTEYIYETASEGEQEEPPRPKPDIKVPVEKKIEKSNKVASDVKPSGGKGKNKKVASGKQPTLMSFFKKA